MSQPDYSHFSLADLFRQETETQVAVLVQGLMGLERNGGDAATLEELMRAAHSLKGAARIVGVNAAVGVAHALEDCFVGMQQGKVALHRRDIDQLLKVTDLLNQIGQTAPEQAEIWEREKQPLLDAAIASVRQISEVSHHRFEAPGMADEGLNLEAASVDDVILPQGKAETAGREGAEREPGVGNAEATTPQRERVLRVTATNLNQLLGLAGEAMVESRWLVPYSDSLLRLKRQQWKLSQTLDGLRETLCDLDEVSRQRLLDAQQLAAQCLQGITQRHEELELFVRSLGSLSNRLYREVLASRMRPFSDGVQGLPRLVRDLAKVFNKEARLEVQGADTKVDREVLEKLEISLTHLIQNALDHGLEEREERAANGKKMEGVISLEARHVAGGLSITVQDDGRGIPLDELRRAILSRKLASEEIVAQLDVEELMEFLFLPGFSLKTMVTEISGRGVGLDIVQEMVREMGGRLRVSSEEGRGTRFQMQLPLTVSIKRALLVEVAGEPYAFPLGRVGRAIRVAHEEIQMLEGREHVALGNERVGLVPAAQLFGKQTTAMDQKDVSIVILGDRSQRFGVAVDRFLGEQQLVVQPLDPRLGKIKDISAGALMPDGTPVLIIDVDDLLRSIELLITGGSLRRVQAGAVQTRRRRKRVLVVDDSLTVRELERKLLNDAGYEVRVAVDGMDGWNAVRSEAFDLVLTDIDMPRLDGIELVRLIKNDARLRELPVMIVSYKDRSEDRYRGMEAGADYYLTKGSFHDETLLNAVSDLIGRYEEESMETSQTKE